MKSYMKFKEYVQMTLAESVVEEYTSKEEKMIMESLASGDFDNLLEEYTESDYAATLFEDEDTKMKQSKSQRQRREQILAALKKNLEDFKSRYGDKAKQVMYAIATKTSKAPITERVESAMEKMARADAHMHIAIDAHDKKHEDSEHSSTTNQGKKDTPAAHHILDQLHQAMLNKGDHDKATPEKIERDNLKPGVHIKFDDGSTHFVHGDIARDVREKIQNTSAKPNYVKTDKGTEEAPSDRDVATKFVSKSHHNLMLVHGLSKD